MKQLLKLLFVMLLNQPHANAIFAITLS